jgi:hypothetical protein
LDHEASDYGSNGIVTGIGSRKATTISYQSRGSLCIYEATSDFKGYCEEGYVLLLMGGGRKWMFVSLQRMVIMLLHGR